MRFGRTPDNRAPSSGAIEDGQKECGVALAIFKYGVVALCLAHYSDTHIVRLTFLRYCFESRNVIFGKIANTE